MDMHRFVRCRYLSRASSSSQVCYSLGEVSKRLRELVENAMQSVWIATAFIDRCGVDLLKRTGDRGAQVRVLTSAEVDEDILRELTKFAEVRVIKSLVECVEVLMASRTLYTPYL
jgi:phosphatidylserine/phosphatidylglycerophosphate/cardiolipin synthase-like enzyme